MSMIGAIQRHITEIRNGGGAALRRKLGWVATFVLNCARKVASDFVSHPFDLLAIPIVLGIRLIRPWFVIRLGGLVSSRIGHLALTELYLCERDAGMNVPSGPYADFHYLAYKPVCNQQLVNMLGRVLRIWPSWILAPVIRANRWIPGGAVHEIGNNTRHERDLHDLLDRFPQHLQFTAEEVARGEAGLLAMGIPAGTPFVCIISRDNAYLDSHLGRARSWNYHDFRNSDIQNWVLAAEGLAERGYFVIRMGSKVQEAIKTAHPKVIDYASNGMRDDFMDIYLGAKCAFCISTGTGWDSIPEVTRRPIVYVNFVPFGYIHTYRIGALIIIKKHIFQTSKKSLTLHEIFTHGVCFSLQASEYESKGIQLIENTPEEIRDAAFEMMERLNGTWQAHTDDEALQKRFREIFQADVIDAYQGYPLHGEIRARFGAHFLRNNRDLLQ